MKRCFALSLAVLFLMGVTAVAADRELYGVTFPGEKIVDGKKLTLNGVACLKKFGFVKVYVGGLYLENPTKDPREVIESEQIKQFDLRYLTDKATAKKLQEGFVELIADNNPPELVKAHKADIDTYVSWFDKDMAPGKTSVTTYRPGVGLTLEWQEEMKGTMPGSEFAQMYFRYTFGDKADQGLKKAYLGLE
ncbi:MAG: chalcone isomerase family protein [Deltaproteobacteria bacterium]|nr:chalcone isomerase family protein [Deltaproteobacteria bacterium]